MIQSIHIEDSKTINLLGIFIKIYSKDSYMLFQNCVFWNTWSHFKKITINIFYV